MNVQTPATNQVSTPATTLKEQCKARLASLIAEYDKTIRLAPESRVSEETIRSWLNEFLAVFGWDVRNIRQIRQEAVLGMRNRQRLKSIGSTHKRPDYTLLSDSGIKTFLDAKSPSIDVFSDRAAEFQIRSYGWSAQTPCAFLSNFKQLAIFDTRCKPDESQDAMHGVIQIGVDEYLNRFDTLFDHLWKDNVTSDGLDRLYGATPSAGIQSLDADFMRVLSTFRRELAAELIKCNPELYLNETSLNYYVQVIMDRVIFIRVCEAKGIEDTERLHEFLHSKKGFWKAFRESCYMEFYRHYDGAMFQREANWRRIDLPDEIFKRFIAELYYPSPYRFDVIPTMMLAKIYEEFLGKRLVLRHGTVSEKIKGEYVKTNGAIPTPEHIVRLVCKVTFADKKVNSIDELLAFRILDPCCGSGVFLIACYDYLQSQFLRILKENAGLRSRFGDCYVADADGNLLLTIPGRRLLMVRCLHGIDVDEAAVEVTKMSLALKMLEGGCVSAWESLGARGKRILRDMAENVKLGNTLVKQTDLGIGKRADRLRAFAPEKAFSTVFESDDPGFRFIVCNPPYVETKFFKEAQPELHSYLSRHYRAYEGKADLAVLFIERCMELLSQKGKAGFVVQRRWFRTDYGRGIRRILNEGGMVDSLVEFDATDIFSGRITYVSILTLSRKRHEAIRYRRVRGNGNDVKSLCLNGSGAKILDETNTRSVDHPSGDSPWVFDSSGIAELLDRLTRDLGRFDAFPGLAIKDGIQALWKKAYHFRDVEFNGSAATGTNGFGERIRIEKDILRGVVYNREFYPFKEIVPDAWCLFPYEGASSVAIGYSDLETRYPLAYAYLECRRKRIRDNVECRTGEKWHTFTREHNHGLYHADKIIVPMTARDVVASYSPGRNGLYMDNANVWFATIAGGDDILMKAVAGVMNATVFSVLAKQNANPQANGYYKFNKQFLAPVPFPSERLLGDSLLQRRLATLTDKIHGLEVRFLRETANRRELVAQQLELLWGKLDGMVESIYGLTDAERASIQAVGRSVSRIALLPEGGCA